MQRCFADFSGKVVPEWIWTRMEGILHKDPGIINQAVMELGATICIQKPRCNLCPIKNFCRTGADPSHLKTEAEQQLLLKKNAKERPSETFDVVVVRFAETVAVTKFPAGVLSNQWMFPTKQVCAKSIRHWSELEGKCVPRGSIRHVFSHRIHNYNVFSLRLSKKPEFSGEVLFTEEEDLVPKLTTGQKKVLALT